MDQNEPTMDQNQTPKLSRVSYQDRYYQGNNGNQKRLKAEDVSAMGLPVTRAQNQTPLDYEGRHDLASVEKSTRVSISLARAMSEPDSPDNLPLRNGDRVFVPRTTHVVTVIGAVLQPHSFAAAPGKSADYYIQRSGGYAEDASKQHVVVVRSNGDALPSKSVKSVDPGDTIIVPTAGLVDATNKVEKVGETTKILSDVLSSVYILTRF